MFRIITTNGVELGVTETVNYIKKNPRNGCFNTCEEKDAIGVSFKSNPYNLFGHADIADVETVLVVKIDGGNEIDSVKAQNVSLTEQLAETDEAAIELYEANLIHEETNAEQDEAIIQIYEMMEEVTNG